MAKLVKSLSKTIVVGEKGKRMIANKIFKTIQSEPNRTKELKTLAVLLQIEHLIFSKQLN